MKHLLTLTLSLIFITASIGQNYELSLGLGGSVYFGDLNTGSVQKNFTLTKPAAEISMAYQLNAVLNFRAGFTFAGAEGDDAIALNEKRKERNLQAQTNIYELSVIGEYYLFGFDYYQEGKFFSPYLMGGISGFYFNPKTEYNGESIRLQPLATEGQGISSDQKKYSLIQGAFIGGAGAKLIMSKRLSLGFEVSMRFTSTDYLDDVSGVYADYDDLLSENGEMSANLSQRIDEFHNKEEGSFPGNYVGKSRGNPDVKDYVMVGLIKLHYNLGRTLFKTVDCPRF